MGVGQVFTGQLSFIEAMLFASSIAELRSIASLQ
jgi:hypothetical protein